MNVPGDLVFGFGIAPYRPGVVVKLLGRVGPESIYIVLAGGPTSQKSKTLIEVPIEGHLHSGGFHLCETALAKVNILVMVPHVFQLG